MAAGVGSLGRPLVIIAEVTASRTAGPTCIEVCSTPAASPCSWSAIPFVAWMFTAGKPIHPIPMSRTAGRIIAG